MLEKVIFSLLEVESTRRCFVSTVGGRCMMMDLKRTGELGVNGRLLQRSVVL